MPDQWSGKTLAQVFRRLVGGCAAAGDGNHGKGDADGHGRERVLGGGLRRDGSVKRSSHDVFDVAARAWRLQGALSPTPEALSPTSDDRGAWPS